MRRAFFDQMQRWLDEGYALHVLCSNDGEQQRFEEFWREQFKSLPSTLHASRSTFSRGFLWPDAKLAVVTDSEIFGRYKLSRPRRKFHAIAQPVDWAELQEGDFVVHAQHGIGKYHRIERTIRGQRIQTQEVLAIEYANEARLYVPSRPSASRQQIHRRG